MERVNFVRDGVSKLPPGFRFEPTDDEIVFQYLWRKIFSHPLPAQIILELDVFSFLPWELPGDESDQEKYFFCKKSGGSKIAGGFWKASGSTKRIISSKRMPILGMRKTLVFYKFGAKNSSCCAVRTDWIMHQYCIALPQNPPHSQLHQLYNSQGCLIRIGEWSLCHIFCKRRMIVEEEEGDDISDTDSSSASSSSPHSDSTLFGKVSSN